MICRFLFLFLGSHTTFLILISSCLMLCNLCLVQLKKKKVWKKLQTASMITLSRQTMAELWVSCELGTPSYIHPRTSIRSWLQASDKNTEHWGEGGDRKWTRTRNVTCNNQNYAVEARRRKLNIICRQVSCSKIFCQDKAQIFKVQSKCFYFYFQL